MVIPAGTREYLSVTVTALPDGTVLTSTAPRFAFLADSNRANPGADDWLTGEWDGATTARILIGPGGGAVALTRGDWHVWINIDPPSVEAVVRRAGTLTVT